MDRHWSTAGRGGSTTYTQSDATHVSHQCQHKPTKMPLTLEQCGHICGSVAVFKQMMQLNKFSRCSIHRWRLLRAGQRRQPATIVGTTWVLLPRIGLALKIVPRCIRSDSIMAAAMAEPAAIVQLSESPMRFTPVNSVTSVFFDEANGQIFVVKEGSNIMDAITMQPFGIMKMQ